MELLPEIPVEIRAARIGTCYDPISRKLMTNKIVIDPTKLPANSINMVLGQGKLYVCAGSESAQNLQQAFFGVDAKTRVHVWATASFNMSSSSSDASMQRRINCNCSHIFTGTELNLVDHGEKEAFNIMTDEFQDALTDLANAPRDEVFVKYMEFVRKFGYGCVTKLYLTSGSAFEITAGFSSRDSASETKYAGSVAVGGSFGGASTAVNYAKAVSSVENSAEVKIEAINIPQTTPTKEWTAGILSSLSNIAFSLLSEKVAPALPYKGDAPSAPAIPAGKPTKNEMPDIQMADITDDVKKQMMKNDGFNVERGWEEYCKEKKTLFLKINPSSTIKEASQLRGEPRNEAPFTTVRELQDIRVAGDANNWDLGGYIPHNFEYKMWHDIFPQLKKIVNQFAIGSLATMYQAQAYVYYTAQLQFMSYLSLFIDISLGPNPNLVGKTSVLEADFNMFGQICDKLQLYIADKAASGKFTRSDFEDVVRTFNAYLHSKEMAAFSSINTYNAFMSNYDFYIENLLGFAIVCVNKDDTFKYPTPAMVYSSSRSNPPLLTELMREAMRTYAITPDRGSFRLVSMDRVGNWEHRFGANYKPTDAGNILTDTNGNKYYRINVSREPIFILEKIKELRIYGAGTTILNNLKGLSMSGVPMVTPLDGTFASLLALAELGLEP